MNWQLSLAETAAAGGMRGITEMRAQLRRLQETL